MRLDGKPVATPAKRALLMPEALARAVAAEWRAQGERVRLSGMPLTVLAGTALDVAGPERAGIVAELASYGRTDLLCHRAEAPEDLARRQAEAWQPWLDWAASTLGVALLVGRGIAVVEQPPAALAALERAIEAHDAWTLAALAQATRATGSIILGLAAIAGQMTAEAASAAGALDELYQEEKWGEDEEAVAAREARAADMAAACRFVSLVRSRGAC